MASHRSGFVALAGRPNVGKSTLLNRLVGIRVAITAPVPQTTRTVLRGVLTRPGAQIIFLDTPGIHEARHRLGEFMVAGARRALQDADLVLWLVDAAGITDEDRVVAQMLRSLRVPVILAVNKTDGADAAPAAERLAAAERTAQDLLPAAATHRISARTGVGVEELVADLIQRLPEGPAYYPEEMPTDQPEQFLIREIIREQAIHHTRQEVPHAVAVMIEEFAERAGGTVYVRATLHVEKASQKKILVGRGGQRLKAIGSAARGGAEALLGRKVFLDLWVTVTPDWREKPALIRGFYPE